MQVNHLPYMLFPPNWPTYIPKDKLANWFEAYVEAMELNFWTETEFEGGSYDEKEGRWTVTLRRADGSKRTMHPRHVVLATGVSGIPSVPEIAGLKDFAGKVMHSSQYDDGENWKGKRAIVIGTGNSGHDIAQDLHSSGADGHDVSALVHAGRQHRAVGATGLCALQRGHAGGQRPDRDLDAAAAGAQEPQR